MPEIIQISVNDKSLELGNDCNLSDLLKQIGRTELKGLALACNETVIPKDKWTSTKLKAGDRILIITATQGG